MQQDTKYVVLRQSENGNWREDSTVSARDSATAIKTAIGKHPSPPAEPVPFVAVPARSWNPVTVTAKVETTFVLGGAA